jgi:hypothetical protein
MLEAPIGHTIKGDVAANERRVEEKQEVCVRERERESERDGEGYAFICVSGGWRDRRRVAC